MEPSSIAASVAAAVAVVTCLITIGVLCFAAGRWRGRFDEHERRIEVLEHANGALQVEIFARLNKLDDSFARVEERLKACQAVRDYMNATLDETNEKKGAT